MATAKKTTKPTTKKVAVKKPAAKKAAPAKTSKKATAADADEEELDWMEVKKPSKKAAKKFAKLELKPIKVPSRTVGKGKKAHVVKAKKLGGSQVVAAVTERSGLARKDVVLVLATLAEVVKASIMPGGVGGAVIPHIGAVMRKDVKARKIPAIARGTVVEKRNPRTGEVTRAKHPGRAASVVPKTVKARAILLSATRRAAFGTQ